MSRIAPPSRPDCSDVHSSQGPSCLDDRDPGRFLDPAEIVQLLGAARDPYRTLYQVAVHTGLRRGELLGLRWRDVDLRNGLLHVRRSLDRVKDGNTYVVREALLKTRASRRTIDLSPHPGPDAPRVPGNDPEGDYVFRSQTGERLDPDNVDRRFKANLTLVGLREIRFHDLLYTHTWLLIAAGVQHRRLRPFSTANARDKQKRGVARRATRAGPRSRVSARRPPRP